MFCRYINVIVAGVPNANEEFVVAKWGNDKVEKGDVLCYVHTNKEEYASILKDIERAFTIVDGFVEVPPTVHDYIHQ